MRERDWKRVKNMGRRRRKWRERKVGKRNKWQNIRGKEGEKNGKTRGEREIMRT